MDAWLRSIGLEAYIAAFREQGITLDLLPELTDADLRELGMTIGDRKRLLRGVVGLRASTPAALTTMSAERRPLSMMFVDIVGYTPLSERLDPEDMLDLLRRYGEFCSGVITKYGGHVARMVGDGVLAYFCYPLANENDPERAVRAGLEIANTVGRLTAANELPVAVRVGIATGPVVIGDLFSGSVVDKHSVVGAAPNLAARLQALAPPGGVIVADETHTRVRGRFVAADMGLVDLRGIDGKRRAWRILRERPVGDVARVTHRAPLCGRDAELARLRACWARVRQGAGEAVLIVGQAGIGKSRLVREFLDGCDGDGGVTVQVHASALDSDSPLRAVVGLARRLAGGGASDKARLRRLAALGFPPSTLPALADLLGLPTPQAEPARTPEQRREALLAALTSAALSTAEQRPLRLVVEDTHWLDPTSLELIRRIAAGLGGRRLLLLMTAREESLADWTKLPDTLQTMRLLPLPDVELMRLASTLLDGLQMPSGLLRSIARRAEGVPLFAQELVRTLATRALDERHDATDDDFEAVVPASVHEALIARLDRTGVAKEIAQAAAVIGRSCPRALLGAVCGPLFNLTPHELESGIDTLVRTGMLAPDDGRRGLTFTHALLRDAAYDSLVRERRRALHLQVALALRATDTTLVQEQPERVAAHLTEGGEPLQAVPLWLDAARKSLARSALTEATRLLRRALGALPRDGSTALAEARLSLLTLLGPALMAVSGPGSPEVAEVYAEAYALCQALPEQEGHFPIYWGWWRLSRDFHDKRDRASTLLSRARSRRNPELLLQAHHCAWASHYFDGNFARCCEHVAAGLAIYGDGDFTHHARLYGNHDAKVCAHGELAQVYWMQGRPVRALAQERSSLQWAAHLDHLGSRAHARDMQLLHRVFRGDHAFVFAAAAELVRLGSDHGMNDARARGLIFRGWAQMRGGETQDGLQVLEEGYAQQRAIGADEDMPLYVTLLAEALVAAGQPERALGVLVAAEQEFAAAGLSFWSPELRRGRAVATLAADAAATDAAQALFAAAVALAEAQGATMLALRAATGATRIALRRGAASEATESLRTLLDAIEGDGGRDVETARQLLRTATTAQIVAPC